VFARLVKPGERKRVLSNSSESVSQLDLARELGSLEELEQMRSKQTHNAFDVGPGEDKDAKLRVLVQENVEQDSGLITVLDRAENLVQLSVVEGERHSHRPRRRRVCFPRFNRKTRYLKPNARSKFIIEI
jgi:hypothetical protein